jgi:hypothetical protein
VYLHAERSSAGDCSDRMHLGFPGQECITDEKILGGTYYVYPVTYFSGDGNSYDRRSYGQILNFKHYGIALKDIYLSAIQAQYSTPPAQNPSDTFPNADQRYQMPSAVSSSEYMTSH